jgi:predicted ATPase
MKISSVSLFNVRSFCGDMPHEMELSPTINVLIGKNNSGKSTIIKSINHFQSGEMSKLDRSKINEATYGHDIKITLNSHNDFFHGNILEILRNIFLISPKLSGSLILEENFTRNLMVALNGDVMQQTNRDNPIFGSTEKDNFIYPFFSKKRATDFSINIHQGFKEKILIDSSNLYAKIDTLNDPDNDKHKLFRDTCIDLFGFYISTLTQDDGKVAGLRVNNNTIIPLRQMGDGIANLLSLIVILCTAENKLFLIEEPENDIHPQALKKLLDLIKNASTNNQFIISTHSNIVLKYLGADPNSKVFKVDSQYDEQRHYPVSSIREVNTTEERLEVLEELGYEFSDYGLYKGWLIFEESSIELIVRNFFIPEFYPKLNGLVRTFSARSVDEVKLKFDNFNDYFVFTHLEPIYKNKAWVIVDGGEEERKKLNIIKEQYKKSGWHDENFIQLLKHDFEDYYPNIFEEEVEMIRKMPHGQHKQIHKGKLLEKVNKWCKSNKQEAKKAFRKSAKEILDILEKIQNSL